VEHGHKIAGEPNLPTSADVAHYKEEKEK
jgi:hypothetical protein